MIKKGTGVTIKNTTLKGVVAGKRIDGDNETLLYRVQYQADDELQERYFKEDQLDESGETDLEVREDPPSAPRRKKKDDAEKGDAE